MNKDFEQDKMVVYLFVYTFFNFIC